MKGLKVLLRRRRLVVFLHLCIALAMAPGILRLKYDNSPAVFFPQDANALKDYNGFLKDFGSGRAIRVAVGGEGLWTRQGLFWLDRLEEQVGKLPGMETAIGLAGLHRWLLLEWPPGDAREFRAAVLKESRDLTAGWVSRGGDTVTLLAVLADMPPQKERQTMDRLVALLQHPPPGIDARLSGLPVLEQAMDESLHVMASRVLPLLVPLAMLFLAATFRRIRDIVAPLAFVGVCLIILFGIMGYAGARLNLVNFVVTPLLFVIALATAIHILVRFREQVRQRQEKSMANAVLETYRDKAYPVLWTGVTTLVAFGSLVTGSLPPLRSVGLWSALGMALMTVMAFTFYPALLAGAKPAGHSRAAGSFERWARRLGRASARLAVRRRGLVTAAAVVTLSAAVLGIAGLKVDDNIGRYFPPHHPVRQELKRQEQSGVGVFSAELLLSAKDGAGFQDPASQQRLASLTARLRTHRPIYGAIGSGDLVEAVLRSMHTGGKISQNSRWMALGLMQSIPAGRKLLYTLLTPDGSNARIMLLVPMLSFHKMEKLFGEVIAEAGNMFPAAAVRITGQYPLLLLAQRKLMAGLIAALSLTLSCILLVFGLILRRPLLIPRVLLPNLWPVAMVIGAMGLLDIPLDSASVMTASVVLGLAVDDTFHTLGHYLRLLPGSGPAGAIVLTLERTAPAHILTTITLTAGFAVCAFSDLLPIARMGTLSAIAIGLALVGDLVLIPSMLSWGDR
jgi:predicted RND superfamily exporter protein